MDLGALESIFDWNFKPKVSISNITLINIETGNKFSKEGDSININLNELSPEEREEILELPKQEFEEEDRILRESEYEEALAIESGYDESSEEIIEFFSDLISADYLDVIEDSLYLRGLLKEKDFTQPEIQRRKSDISYGKGEHARYISSLTTAGYFHPNGGIRDLLVTMRLNEGYEPYKFQNELEYIFEHKLMAVFVEKDDSPYEVTNDVRGRLEKYDEIDPVNDWMEIRGIGNECKTTIEDVVVNLQEEFGGIDIDRYNEEFGQHVARIHPYSVSHSF